LRTLYRAVFELSQPRRPRVLAVDGTKVLLPPVFVGEGFRLHCRARRHPSATLSCIFDTALMRVHDVAIHHHHDERGALCGQLSTVQRGDTLLLDRGYYSGALAAELQRRGVRFVFRLKDNTLRRRGGGVARVVPRAGNTPLHLNVFTHRAPSGASFRFATSPDIRTVAVAAGLYRRRWRVEEGFRSLKCNLDLETLCSRTEHGLQQEVWGRALLQGIAATEEVQHRTTPRTTPAGRFTTKPNQRVLIGILAYLLLGGVILEDASHLHTGALVRTCCREPGRDSRRERQ
jgi:hypothetical protein